jgi:catechol 2,3-dioxygenase-like lactoylglutathione lyase family enzyme
MGLSDGRIGAAVAVTDMGKAIEFYENKLGLAGGGDEMDGGRTYRTSAGTTLHVFPSPHAKASGATAVGIMLDDVEGTVDELIAKGVTFEQYDEGPAKTDDKGIARMGDFVGAWMKDPDGNVIALGNM